eukprot:CAMPEP_0197449642 /NCGR_PEP_ID=MMETSP1175-20131217/22348_1 /TAXON_ID=1003142 /ORGANISM="Triceratium dubium, Strain CCMP147" /LENGTH=303 /DNA_ID=CAMNT_0042981837 /DNA_START=39 /DNA_END=950 /DNA_ORIENTATION=-
MTFTAARAASLLARNIGRAPVATAARTRTISPRHGPSVSSALKFAGGSRGMASLSGGDALAKLASDSPHMDVIRYHHKNVKWTLRNVNYYSDALAIGFLDQGLQPGDVVLSWLPLHFSEQHILQFACSKSGLVLYHLDPAQAIDDREGAKKALAQALEITEANVLVTQEAGSDVNYVHLVKSVIPEIRIFNHGDGMPFFTPRFPHLRIPIHTGFDITDKSGMEVFKHMLSPSNNLDTLLRDTGSALDGKSPLMGELVMGKDGLPQKGKILSNEDVVKNNVWPEFASILNKEYKEVEGVGNVFV